VPIFYVAEFFRVGLLNYLAIGKELMDHTRIILPIRR
jgi:hypothetical protein